jgi:hypothetical protein
MLLRKNAYLAKTTPHHGQVTEVNFIPRVRINVPFHRTIITELCYLVKLCYVTLFYVTLYYVLKLKTHDLQLFVDSYCTLMTGQ